jgi:hypothetical protein
MVIINDHVLQQLVVRGAGFVGTPCATMLHNYTDQQGIVEE